jgi:hypothetical protein
MMPDESEDLVAVFPSGPALLDAVRALKNAGHPALDTWAPYDLEDPLDDALELRKSPIPWIVLAGGLTGLVLAFAIEWWADVHSYPLDVGGRPRLPLPAYVPIMFETTVLASALTVLGSWLLLLRLPRLWAPVDELAGVEHTSLDQFWLRVGAADGSVALLLQQQGAVRVTRMAVER